MSDARDLNPIELAGTVVAAAVTAPLAFGLVVLFILAHTGLPTFRRPR